MKVNESGWNKYTLDFHIGKNIQILFTDNIVATVKSQVIETRKVDETYKLVNINEAPSGNLWLGSNTGEVVIVHPSFYSTITKENGGPAASISSIYNDRHGNIWINTYGEGIYMTFASNFRSIINKNDDLFKLSGSIYASENNGVLLFEHAEGGICLMQPDYLISKYQHNTLKNITGIAMTGQKIWVTSMHGFYEISNDSIYHYKSLLEEGFNSNTGLMDNNNNLIINNYNYGWFNFDPKNRIFNVAVHKQRTTYTYNSFVDSKGRVWISSAEGGLFFVEVNLLTSINKDILQINDLTEDLNGNIFIAGSEGLFEYTSNGEFFELRWESETHTNVRSILYDKNLNSIWLGTTKGLKLYEIDDEQIEQFGNNRGINGDYFSKNGVSNFNGRTYWSTNNSVVEFIPFDFSVSATPPEIYVQSILLDYLQPDYEYLKLQTLLYFDSLINNVPYGLNLTEEFNSISFVLGSDLLGINTGLSFYYSIDNEDWVGPILNEEITINNLTIGKHLIQFKAIDINEIESNTIRFEFEVTKPIYKQAWFLILISVLFIGLLIGFYLVRNRISFKRFEAYSNFNTNLSRLQFLSGLFTIGFPLMEWSNVVLNENEVFRWSYLLSITTITLIFFICTFIKNINARFITYFALFGSTFIVIMLIDRVFTEHLSNAYMILAIISMAFMVIVYNSFKTYLIHFVLVNSFFVTRTIYYEDYTPDLVVFVVGFIFIQLFSVIFHFFQINRLDKINFSERILNTYDKLVLVYNEEGNVVYVNPYLCNLVNEDEDNILGDKWYEIRHCDAERTASIKDSIKKQIKNSNSIETITEIIYSVPLKVDRYINWSFQILDDKYLMAIGNDITEAHLHQLEIEQAHQIIEENNRDMLDSINYALRIQQSLLPNLSIVSKTLPNHFIYYRPKDIVSGDFYYLETLGSKIFIGIADCTGHGVPGAMMTSIGSAALNNAILDKKISDPGKILTHVDSYFKASLSLNKDGYTDGMDISLIAINLEDKILEYCGAKRPLITYTPEKGMTTYLGTKRSIGESNLNDDSIFTTTTIPIENEMQVYAFTDGITDQFGGPAGKKFYITNLYSLIESILELPMHEQEEIITNTILQWMGEDHSQTDDMLMLGFKIDQAYLNKMSRILG
ncbi:MAG: SpoIIE family protein phosphatase [Flavobacteriales bacterium]|nr:SpoIIE family protein phosphatase [Flavobacteriales bacterium]